MNAQRKTLTRVLGGVFAASFAAAPMATAAGNPFALTPLSAGYMVADHHEMEGKMQDGKMKEGGCSANMEETEGKMKEGSCGADKTKEGNCGADKGKMKEGNCSSGKS